MSFAIIFTLIRYWPMAFKVFVFVMIGPMPGFFQTILLYWRKHWQAVSMRFLAACTGTGSSFQNFWVNISVILRHTARCSLSSLMTLSFNKSALAASPECFLLPSSFWLQLRSQVLFILVPPAKLRDKFNRRGAISQTDSSHYFPMCTTNLYLSIGGIVITTFTNECSTFQCEHIN